MSEIKLNVSVPKKLGINAGPTELLSGATFIPNVDEQGNISWTNEKGLENPPTQNIMGPQGKDGPPGPQGEPGKDGKTYELPIASAETLGGIKIGEGLEIDPLTGILKAIGESGGGLVELVSSADAPVNLNDIRDGGIYRISGTDIMNCFTSYFKGDFILIVYKDNFMGRYANGINATQQFIIYGIGNGSNNKFDSPGFYYRAYNINGSGNWYSWTSHVIPILSKEYTQANASRALTTEGSANMYNELMDQINELKSRIDNLESN